MTKLRRIASHLLFSPQGFLKNRVVTINSRGEVTDIAHSSRIDSLSDVEFYGGIMIPAMVNAHCHLELSYLKGVIPQRGGFAAFGKSIAANRGRFTMEDMKAAAAYRDARMWSEGVGAVADISNSTFSLEIKSESRIYYHTFAELFGLAAEDTSPVASVREQSLEMGLECDITPHSTYSLNTKAFRSAIGAGAGPLSIHFMESAGESQLFEKRGEIWEWYQQSGLETDFLECGSPCERIIEEIPSTREVMLIHNTFIGREHIDALKRHFGDNLTMVLCPRSNIYINNTLPPFELFRESGVRVAIGTDSMASNSSLSMIEELKAMNEVPLEESLEWATAAGARALGIDTAGTIEVGKRCGIAVIENADISERRLTPLSLSRRIV